MMSSGCTLQLARNSPLRTTLVDESTGNAIYRINTPIRIVRSVTRIRKFDSSKPQLHRNKGTDSDSDSGKDITDVGKRKRKKRKKSKSKSKSKKEKGGKEEGEEIARIRWKCFSSDKIDFQGKATTRREFLPKTGKMKG